MITNTDDVHQEQLFLAPRLHRAGDHDTSRAAGAAQVPHLTERINIVVEALRRFGPMTDDELRDTLRNLGYQWPHGSPSKRRCDAVALGLVVDTGRRRTTSAGSSAKVWASVAGEQRAVG